MLSAFRWRGGPGVTAKPDAGGWGGTPSATRLPDFWILVRDFCGVFPVNQDRPGEESA